MKSIMKITLSILLLISCLLSNCDSRRLKQENNLTKLTKAALAIQTKAKLNINDCNQYLANFTNYVDALVIEAKKKNDELISCQFICPDNTSDNYQKQQNYFLSFLDRIRQLSFGHNFGRLFNEFATDKKGLMNIKCTTRSSQIEEFKNAMKKYFKPIIEEQTQVSIRNDPILNMLYNEKTKTKCTDYKKLINERLKTMRPKDGTEVDQACEMKCVEQEPSRMSSDDFWPIGYIAEFKRNNFIYNNRVELWIGYHINEKNGRKEFESCTKTYNDGD
jgi:uncharacterized protein YaaR (DUF327 family)